MKYLKPFFESFSYIDELSEHRDDVIRVFTEYSELYIDSNTERLWEFAWDITSDDITEEEIESADKMTNRIVTAIVDDIISHNNERSSRSLMELYYDCNYALGKNSIDVVDNIRDIFAEYLDDKKASFYKSSDKYDNRYIVEIKQDDILKTLDFNEIMGRIDDLVGLPQVNYSGNNHFIKFEFFESYPDED
jgi:hypothetical protein